MILTIPLVFAAMTVAALAYGAGALHGARIVRRVRRELAAAEFDAATAESPYRLIAGSPLELPDRPPLVERCKHCARRGELIDPLPSQEATGCPRCKQNEYFLQVAGRCVDRCKLASGARLPHVHACCQQCQAEWTEMLPEHYAAVAAATKESPR